MQIVVDRVGIRLISGLRAAAGQHLQDELEGLVAGGEAVELVGGDGAELAEAGGAGALPNGEAYYAAQLKLQTTTDMTASEIHDLGLSEVARIRAEMEAVKARTGFTGSLADFFVFMRTDKRFYFANTDAGRDEYLKTADRYLSGMKKKLPEYFGILPKADLVVKRVEAFREIPGAAQHYFPGTPDGSRPGIFYSHLSDMNAMRADVVVQLIDSSASDAAQRVALRF